jgi:uncharacterized ubiquitin-like protein YukD
MPEIQLDIQDATGNKKQSVQVPHDAPADRLIAVLIQRMNFPTHGPDGQLLSYKLQHKRTGRQLLDDQTLLAAGVMDGDALRLLPEITAGTNHRGARVNPVGIADRRFRFAGDPLYVRQTGPGSPRDISRQNEFSNVRESAPDDSIRD